ncbi:hypothetical protein C8D94_101398 [Marinirhabdus gelatinilytica]|uniref:IPT/TIG domain-containing protein n=2 Tax=Marinirhabdus gelatinilytica TaxID=1703343 RepID=A0A370QJK1_9FLAO|nr:hypothetical protein C8D94_101398 [Marinirhabdus gelatinilytica]
MRLIALLITTLLFVGCSSSDDMNEQVQNSSNFSVIDYNPKETYTAEEVTIQTEGLDPTATIEVHFSGVKSDKVSINGNAIVARVPRNSSSGDLTITMNGNENIAGTISITEETDDFYIAYEDSPDEPFSLISFRPYDIGNDMVGDPLFNMTQIGPFVSNIEVSKSKNLLYFANSVDCGQTGGCFGEGYLYDLSNNEKIETFPIFSDAVSFSRSIISTFEDAFFWISRNNDPIDMSRTFVKYNLDTGLVEQTIDLIAQGDPKMPLQVFLPETNEIVGFWFGNNKYGRTSLDTFQYVEYTKDHYIKNLNITSEGKLIGNSYLDSQLVEIDKINGDVLDIIYATGYTIQSWEYSSSTGRYFILEKCCANEPRSRLNIYNPTNGVTTLLSDNLEILGIFSNN